MATPRLIFAIAAAAVMGGAPALAQSCHPMQSSAMGVDTGASAVLPERCDQPGKCRIFDIGGHPIGEPGDFVIPGTASPGDLLAVERKRSGLQGYIDRAGGWKIEPQYKRVGPFCEDRAAAQRVDSRWIYIDRQGEQIGEPWDGAEAFTDGRGLVTVYKGGDKFLHGYIDASGKVVIPAQFAAARLFSEGFAAVRVGDKWGYIDRDGNMTIAPRFAEAEAFRGGRAVVRVSEGFAKNSGLIDRSGKFVVKPLYEQISKISDGGFWTLSITDPGYRGNGEPPFLSRVVDAHGRFISGRSYASVDGPAEGLMAACRNDSCGFIDTHGKSVIAMKFKYAGDFQEGLAAVSTTGNRYGFIDREGKMVLPERYDSLDPRGEQFGAGPFVNGLAPAGCKGHWGFIDKDGAWAIPPVYRFAEAFENGFAPVQIKTGTGHVRPDGGAIDFDRSEMDEVSLPARPCGAPMAMGNPK
jgi:hypothetical protein